DLRAVVITDRLAGVEDRAEQLVLAVLGADRREVWADPLALPLHAVAAAATIGAGAEEDLAAVVGLARPTDQLGDRRQGAAGRRLGQRQDARGLVADVAVGVVVQDRGRLGLQVGRELLRAGQLQDPVGAVEVV